jgi:hypothetical protein
MTKIDPDRIVTYIISMFYLDVPGIRFDGEHSQEEQFLIQIFNILEDFQCLNKRGLAVKANFLAIGEDKNHET